MLSLPFFYLPYPVAQEGGVMDDEGDAVVRNDVDLIRPIIFSSKKCLTSAILFVYFYVTNKDTLSHIVNVIIEADIAQKGNKMVLLRNA